MRAAIRIRLTTPSARGARCSGGWASRPPPCPPAQRPAPRTGRAKRTGSAHTRGRQTLDGPFSAVSMSSFATKRTFFDIYKLTTLLCRSKIKILRFFASFCICSVNLSDSCKKSLKFEDCLSCFVEIFPRLLPEFSVFRRNA